MLAVRGSPSWALCAVLALASTARAEPCSEAALARILAPATESEGAAIVDCDLDLTPQLAGRITRDLSFVGAASSGVTLDCHGGVLGSDDAPIRVLVLSRRIGTSPIPGVGIWEPATDVTIRGCEIHGSVRVRGMGSGHWDDEVTTSSHFPLGHVARVRAAAPRRVTLEDLSLVAAGGTPLFVSPGVQDVSLLRSEVTGFTNEGVAIYLDAESRGTTVRDCVIDTAGWRELIAIDGSEDNRFLGNWLSSLHNGGIYLYRNCGERAFVRMTPAQHNEIIGNVFYYDRYRGPNPAVFLGSDDGFSTHHHFCHHDLAFPFGTGVDDRDLTRHNAVMQNQIYRRSAAEMIHTEWPDSNGPNYVEQNTTVETAVSRPLGCFTRADHEPRYLPHGARTLLTSDRDGRPYERAVEVTCVDGDLEHATTPELRATRELSFGCSAHHDNGGCRAEVRCAPGETLVGARVACNLEFGPVTDAQLASVPPDALWVVRQSDVALAGRCWIGDHGAAAGEVPLAGALRQSAASFGCREHDRNGGDCEIRGVAHCAATSER
jgi:hypothetical protein